MVLTYFCPWTLDIAIVLLRLRFYYSVEIKCYKSQTRQNIFVHKNKASYSLEVLYKMLTDQCEEVNVIGEVKVS